MERAAWTIRRRVSLSPSAATSFLAGRNGVGMGLMMLATSVMMGLAAVLFVAVQLSPPPEPPRATSEVGTTTATVPVQARLAPA